MKKKQTRKSGPCCEIQPHDPTSIGGQQNYRTIQTFFFHVSGVSNKLSLLSININGKPSKLEADACRQLLTRHDIIMLSEIKTSHSFSIPGYKTIRSNIIQGEEHRGGVAVLIKHKLWDSGVNAHYYKDQIWFSIGCVPQFYFGACYITPRDSPFFETHAFGIIQEECQQTNKSVIIMGDLNARIPDLNVLSTTIKNIKYTANPDHGSNTHGKEIISLCTSLNPCPINHLIYDNKTFDGGYTFRKKDKWISQLDLALCSTAALPNTIDLKIHNDIHFPSTHAPISL